MILTGPRKVTVVPLGEIPPAFLWFVTRGIERYLPVAKVELRMNGGFDPGFAVDPKRKQARVEMLLDQLSAVKDPNDLTLGICDVDIYAPGLNFIFGQANPTTRTAVISLARLAGPPGSSDREELRRIRALKEAIHELGHLMGVGHCRNTSCIMHFSETVASSDRKTPEFCPRCLKRISGS